MENIVDVLQGICLVGYGISALINNIVLFRVQKQQSLLWKQIEKLQQ